MKRLILFKANENYSLPLIVLIVAFAVFKTVISSNTTTEREQPARTDGLLLACFGFISPKPK